MALAITWSNETGGSTLSARLNFVGNNATNIGSSDFRVLNSSNDEQSGWTISPSASTASNGGFVTVTATPPSNMPGGQFKLRLMPFTIHEGSAQHPAFPTANLDSAFAGVYRQATASWSSPIETSTGYGVTADLTFAGANITNLSSSDFEIENNNGFTQTGWTISPRFSSANAGVPIAVIATPPSNTGGTFLIRLKANTVRSGGSPGNNSPTSAADTATFNFDNRPAIATWSNVLEMTTGKGITANLTFTRSDITGLSASDIDVVGDQNAVQTGWTISVSSSTATAGGIVLVSAVAPANTQGSFGFRLRSNTARSTGSQTDNTPASNVSSGVITYDNRPAVAAWSVSSIVDGGNAIRSFLTFQRSNITGLSGSDIEVLNDSNAVQSGWTVVTPAVAAPGISVPITATAPADTHGMFKLRLKADSIMNLCQSEITGPAMAITNDAIAFDNRPVIATAAWSVATGGDSIKSTLTFSGADVTHIEQADFEILDSDGNTVSGWAVGGFSGAGTASDGVGINITANAPFNTSGMFRIRLKADSVRSGGATVNNAPENPITTNPVAIDTLPIAATAEWSNVSGGIGGEPGVATIKADLTFRLADITGLGGNDIVVLDDADDSVQSGWLVNFFSNAAAMDRPLKVTASPPSNPANTDGMYKLRLNALSVSSGGGTNNAPVAATVSDAVRIDNVPRAANVTWTNVSGGSTLSGSPLFTNPEDGTQSFRVGGIQADSFDIIDSDGRVVDRSAEIWQVVVNTNSAPTGSTINVIITPPGGDNDELNSTNGYYKIRFKQHTAGSDGGTDNVPTMNLDSQEVLVKRGLVVPSPEVDIPQYYGIQEFERNLDLVRASRYDVNNTITVIESNLPGLVQTLQDLERIGQTQYQMLFGQREIILRYVNQQVEVGDYLIDSTGERLAGQQLTGQPDSPLGYWQVNGQETVGQKYQVLHCTGTDGINLR